MRQVNIIRFAPPLVIDEDDLNKAIQIIAESLKEIDEVSPPFNLPSPDSLSTPLKKIKADLAFFPLSSHRSTRSPERPRRRRDTLRSSRSNVEVDRCAVACFTILDPFNLACRLLLFGLSLSIRLFASCIYRLLFTALHPSTYLMTNCCRSSENQSKSTILHLHICFASLSFSLGSARSVNFFFE